MGFSPGDFYGSIQGMHFGSLHWEVGSGTIKLWNNNESELILLLDEVNARAALDQLQLLVEMLPS